MNGNIKRLAKEANLLERPAITWSCAPVEVNFFTNAMIEKFSELIILECARVVKASSPNGMIGVNAIRIHFGVEP